MNSESSSRKKIVVVLGMHRSGTSAVTKSLEALGVQLGDNLMPPVEEANAKGYFEDMDTFLLNVGLQANLEGDWDSLSLSADPEFQEHRLAKFRLRAVELIRKKCKALPFLGSKTHAWPCCSRFGIACLCTWTLTSTMSSSSATPSVWLSR